MAQADQLTLHVERRVEYSSPQGTTYSSMHEHEWVLNRSELIRRNMRAHGLPNAETASR